jgi:hypothetical protein
MIKRSLSLLTASALLWGAAASCALAQKGMGKPVGVASQAVKPRLTSLSGVVLAVETGPCEQTTGRADSGSHFLLKTQKNETLNIHLGPAAAVDHVVQRLPAHSKVEVNVFRTAAMPPGHYVAQSLALDGTTIRLRDQQLRPFWARGGASRGRGAPQYGPGTGQGCAWKNGFGYGPGRGRGWRGGGGRGRGWR